MTELFGYPEEAGKLIDEFIVRLRSQIADEQAATYHRIQRIEHDSRQRIRDAQRDFVDRVEPMRRELDELLKVATIKYVTSPIAPMIVPAKDLP